MVYDDHIPPEGRVLAAHAGGGRGRNYPQSGGARGVQRQFTGYFQASGGDACRRRHCADGGDPLRLEEHLVPRSARKSAPEGTLRIAKKIYIIISNNKNRLHNASLQDFFANLHDSFCVTSRRKRAVHQHAQHKMLSRNKTNYTIFCDFEEFLSKIIRIK